MRLRDGFRRQGNQSSACAKSIPPSESPASGIGFRFGDRKIWPNSKRVCEKPGWRNSRSGLSLLVTQSAVVLRFEWPLLAGSVRWVGFPPPSTAAEYLLQ